MPNLNPDIFIQISELSEDVYFIFNTNQKAFEYISQAFEKVWGQPAQLVSNSPNLLLQTIHAEDRLYVKERYQNAITSTQAGIFEFRITCPDQSIKYILLKLYPLLKNGTTGLVAGVAEDISVTKNNIFYAEMVNARKNSMLEILSHDLKGPIGMINVLASSLQKNLKDTANASMLRSVQSIQKLCKRNISLIRNLVNQEFLESTEVEIRKERADLVWGINDIIENYKRSADVISRTFIINSATEKLYLQMDSLKLMQVFNNLISNALKFTPDNGIIELDIQDKGTSAQVTVRDNGIGIPENLQPYLFDKFTRARRTGLRGEEPVGLGMSIIKTIVELHGGKIWFESKENVGSTFYIEIPKV